MDHAAAFDTIDHSILHIQIINVLNLNIKGHRFQVSTLGSYVIILKKATNITNIAVANNLKVWYRLSFGRFTFDLVLFWKSRSCTFRLRISCKQTQIGQILLLPTNRKLNVVFQSVWDIYNCTWAILKVKVNVMHITVNISQTMTDRTNTVISNTGECGLSISIFTFDLDAF